ENPGAESVTGQVARTTGADATVGERAMGQHEGKALSRIWDVSSQRKLDAVLCDTSIEHRFVAASGRRGRAPISLHRDTSALAAGSHASSGPCFPVRSRRMAPRRSTPRIPWISGTW